MTSEPSQAGVTMLDNIGDGFAWPFQGPNWFGKMVLQGLIWVIPIVGGISLGGWLMRTIDNYRAGRRELAPAGFHLARGVPVSFVFLIYGLVLVLPGVILTNIAGAVSSGGLFAIGGLAYLAAWLLLTFLTPVLILFVYREASTSAGSGGRPPAPTPATRSRPPRWFSAPPSSGGWAGSCAWSAFSSPSHTARPSRPAPSPGTSA